MESFLEGNIFLEKHNKIDTNLCFGTNCFEIKLEIRFLKFILNKFYIEKNFKNI